MFDCKNYIKTRRRRKENAKQRAASFSYFVRDGNRRMKVCRTAFMSMHGIRQKRLFRITTLLLKGDTPKTKEVPFLIQERHQKISQNFLSDHIWSFPLKVTYYVGQDVKYLDTLLSIVTLHNLFVTKYSECGNTYIIYRAYFVYNFNYRFGRLQIDVSSTFEELTAKLKSAYQ
ncbi:hypothetical protein PR048_008893 [Dryococelus australis]|uniref:Uncharacterized protein n=1 Tax=Dryococelus australis TaxID=614101 RepID=A0ABQ9HYE6_9NEOP|nr:hypothetical protein PR048_008893 [Dryococelus australis]